MAQFSKGDEIGCVEEAAGAGAEKTRDRLRISEERCQDGVYWGRCSSEDN